LPLFSIVSGAKNEEKQGKQPVSYDFVCKFYSFAVETKMSLFL
jgi:hypothetical protein